MKQGMKKIVISWLVCVLGLAALSVWFGIHTPWSKNALVSTSTGGIKASYSLQDSHKKPITEATFKGKYQLIFFGFTHCPNICPTTLLMMQNALNALNKNELAKVQSIFITIDPERDTPEVVGKYVGNFGTDIVGLTGSEAQIQSTVDHFKVYSSKQEDATNSSGYMMDHSGFIYLIGPDGKYLTHFASDISDAALVKSLREYLH